MTPRMHIVWTVLENAKLHGDELTIGFCRALIVADRGGWKRNVSSNPVNAARWAHVRELYA